VGIKLLKVALSFENKIQVQRFLLISIVVFNQTKQTKRREQVHFVNLQIYGYLMFLLECFSIPKHVFDIIFLNVFFSP